MLHAAPVTPELVTRLVCDLVAIPSVNPAFMREGDPREHFGEGGVAEYLVETLKRWKIDVETVPVLPGRPNVIAKIEGRSAKRRLVWQTHMDTVQADRGMEDPFRPRVASGKIYGRGAVDAKGQLGAMMAALFRLVQTQPPACDLYFVASVDEEHNFRGVHHLVESGLRADGGIVGEPTNLQVVRACKGCVRWDVHVLGKAAHTSRPHLGRNAIDDAMGLLAYLRETLIPRYEARAHPLVGPPTLTASLIRGGAGVNTVPDRCVVTFDRRVIPGETPEQALKEFAEAVEEYCLRTGSRVEIEQPFTRDIPMEVPAEAEIVAVTRAAARQILGEATVTGAPYSCDATKMTAAGIPTIVFGPGDIAQAHARDESIEVDQILLAVAVLTEIAWSFGQDA